MDCMGNRVRITSLSRTFLTLLLGLFLTGCSSLPLPSMPWSEPAPASDPDAEAIFNQAIDHVKNKKYARAIIQFEKVRDEFPFSAQAVESELKIAEAQYLNKQYPEAALGFKDFLALHPTSKHIPFVIYHLGLVHFDQFTSIDRDQKEIEIAQGYFETVIKEHPKSPYVADANEKLAKGKEFLAEHEFYVASFYLKEKKYPAARERFENIVRRYPNTPTAAKALYLLGESYLLEKNYVKATLAYEALIRHYPDSPMAIKASVHLSQLDKEDQDPLAMLLMRDGRPVFIPPPENGQQKEVVRVAKKEVVTEEGGAQRGFFRRIADTINPFSSSGEKEEEKKENGKEEGGFLGLLWPFGESKKEKDKTSEQGDAQLLSKVDESLKKKGMLKTQNQESKIESPELRPPTSDLPQVTEETTLSSANPAEVLADVDERLESGGKNLNDLPPPPKVSSKLFAPRPSKSKKKRSAAMTRGRKGQTEGTTSPSTSRLLDSIDKGLKGKGMEPPQLEPIPTGRPKGNRERAARPQNQEKVELSPRLSTEKNPLLDAGGYQLKEKPGEAGKPGKREGSDASKQAGLPVRERTQTGVQASEPLKELPKGVVKGPPTDLPKERPAEITSADKKSEDEEKGALDQITDDLKSLGSILNPFSW